MNSVRASMLALAKKWGLDSSCQWARLHQSDPLDEKQSLELEELAFGEVEQLHHEFDNTKANCNFSEAVDNNYQPIRNFMRSEVDAIEKHPHDQFGQTLWMGDRSGEHIFHSARGVWCFHGWEGRARCVAMPQCKMMNSLVFDDVAEHKVIVEDYASRFDRGYKPIRELGDGELPLYVGKGKKKRFSQKKLNEYLLNMGYNPYEISNRTHLPFDVYAFVGCLFGKLLHLQRRFFNNDARKLPRFLWFGVDEAYETLNPGHKWKECRSKAEFAEWCEECAWVATSVVLLMDMPLSGKRRKIVRWNGLVRFFDKVERFGNNEAIGFKVDLGKSPLFDFCFLQSVAPRVVQINCGVLDTRDELGAKSTTRALHSLYAAWIVMYRNYWITREQEFKTCVPIWSRSEMERAFSGSRCKFGRISVDCMKKIMERFTIKYHQSHAKLKWNGFVGDFEKVDGKEALRWTLPSKATSDPVYFKDEKGKTHSVDDVVFENQQVQGEFIEAWDDIVAINHENSKHRVTLNGTNVATRLSAVGRVASDKMEVVSGEYMRNYTHINGFQSIKSKERKDLRIDGGKVCELDFSALHPTMMLAMQGIAFSGDAYNLGRKWHQCYNIGSVEARQIAKIGLLTYVNAKSRARAFNSLKNDWCKRRGYTKGSYVPWLKDFEKALFAKYQKVSGLLCSGIGTRLQYIDGKMMRKICRRLTSLGICALPIHDSVIVRKEHSDICRQIMLEEYSNAMGVGFTCAIKEK